MSDAKTIVVVVDTVEPARVREALRAAVGLGLRGDRVELAWRAVAAAVADADPVAARALATLELLGHRVVVAGDTWPDELRAADVVEVWT